MILKTSFQNIPKRSHRICSNFAKTEAITRGVHTPLSDFFKKLLGQRNTKINEKRNGVIALLWRLRLQENPDHKKVSSLYNTAVVTFFPYLYSRRHSWRPNLGGIPPKKSSRATLGYKKLFSFTTKSYHLNLNNKISLLSKVVRQFVFLFSCLPKDWQAGNIQ